MIQIINNYRDNAGLRRSFNELADKTFGLNFEDWYQNGFWGDDYNPYSVVRNGEIIANVSVNRTDFRFDGGVKHFLQLGTVMTRDSCRHQGYIRAIMERIDADYGGKTDGIYLFANDSVLDFYPKFGFCKSREYRYSTQLHSAGACKYQRIAMDCPASWQRLRQAMERNVFQGRLDMVGNSGLLFFYVSGFMQDNVYYHAPSDTYVIAEQEGQRLFLHNVFSGTLTELSEVLALFGESIRQVTLGFTPLDQAACEAEELQGKDCTFFIRGDALKIIEQEKLCIPSLSHA